MHFARFIFLTLALPATALAQADFTRQFLSSGHYEVRPSAERSRRPANEDAGAAKAEENAEEKTKTTPTEPQAIETKANPAAEVVATETKVENSPLPPSTSAEAKAAVEEAEPGVVDQMKSLFDPENDVLVRYQEKVHPEDQRLNRLEIEGRAGFSTVESTSNYSFRRYESSFATVDLRSTVWAAPSFGLTGAIRFSLGGSIPGDPATGSMDRMKDEELEMGLRFRRFFGLSRLSPSLEFGMIYHDHSFNVSTDSVRHPRWRSSGFGAVIRSRVPVSADRAWTFGGRVFPRLKHQETATTVDVESGAPGEFVRIDLEAGGDLAFGRGQQFIYGIQVGAERDLFDGPASVADPDTAQTPSNVTVTNTQLNFSFGYRWGR